MKTLSKFIFTTLFGWKIIGEFPKDIQKYIVIGAPHTSYWDFVIGMFVRNIKSERINFIGKASLFKPPFGFVFKWLGGTPVDRSKNNNLVDAIVQVFNNKEKFRLALSPEGTRKKVAQWKTGFYYIAKGAKVPIVMFTFDFGKKQVALSKPFYPTESLGEDMKFIQNFYKDVKGKHPKNE
ncbi:MAG: lysophospholipid acyltransferase family protein [Flavobacteriaceae bacterium]